MPYPRSYEREYDFYGYQTANPNKPLPGDHVNDELNDVELSTQEIVDFIKKFTTTDGRLAPNTVGPDQLDPSISLSFEPPSPWLPNTEYSTRSTVFYDNNFYVANVAHVSGAAFDPTKWDLLADFNSVTADAEAARDEAEAAALAAAGSASAAGGSASAAATSASQSGNSATASANSAQDSQNAAADATAASAIANTKAAEASTSATQAADSEAQAEVWAQVAETGILPDESVGFGKLAPALIADDATAAAGLSLTTLLVPGRAGMLIDARNIDPSRSIAPTVVANLYTETDALGRASHALTSANTSDQNLERYTAFIGNYDSGTGDGTVPASTYALGISALKKDWATTAREGQVHGLSIVTRGGFHGPDPGIDWYNPGDTAAFVINTSGSAAQSYIAAGEGVAVYAKDGVYAYDPVNPVRQIRFYLPSIRAKDNAGIGHLVVAESGPLGAAYQAQNRIDLAVGAGVWSHFLRYIANFGDGHYEPFVVNQIGHVVMNNGPVAAAPNSKKTLRVGDGGAFEIVNSAGSAISLAVSDGGSLALAAGQVVAIGGQQVLAPRQAAIPNAAAGTENARIQDIINTLRVHGLIAT